MASSQSAISRRSSGGFDRIGRSGASRRFQRLGSSTTTTVRWDAGQGVVPRTACLLAASTHCLMSSTEPQIAGEPPRRRCGSHFAQSHMAARSGLVTTTRSRSAGPCSVAASTMSVRASAERTRSDPVIAIARSLLQIGVDNPRARRVDAQTERQHECIRMIGSTFPQGRRRIRCVAKGVDDGLSIRRRAATGRAAERHDSVAVRNRQRSWRSRRCGRGEPKGAGSNGQRAIPPGRRRRHGCSVECHVGPLGRDRDLGRTSAGRGDGDLEHGVLDRCEVEFVGVRSAPRSEAVSARTESCEPAGSRPSDLSHLDVGVRCERRTPGFGVEDRTDHQSRVVQGCCRVDRVAVDQREPRNRLTGDHREYVTQRGGGCVGDDRHVGITMGGAHDDVHRPEHYGTGPAEGDVSVRCSRNS